MFEQTRRFALPPISAAVTMFVAVMVGLHRGWVVTQLWLLALPVLVLVWVVVIVVFAVAIGRARRFPRRWPVVVTAVFAVIGTGGPALFVAEPEVGVFTRFWLERPAFAAVAATSVPARPDDYYGSPLPSHLCLVSANCRVAVIGTSGGHPVRFVPDHVGIPDGATGYAHFRGAPGPGPYDGFGDPICPKIELSGGWWWLGGCT
ncbi:hypothetical protein [Nocardia sp. No.11]|uniref:hypothetical protein n=1 Tax=Nocardia sp. No.11 TaxID=3128861 RepID=UPI00319DD9FB